MLGFNHGYCSFEEYASGESIRVSEQELAVGVIYVIMFALKRGGPQEAAAFPAQVAVKNALAEGQHVQFESLDEDLQPTAKLGAIFTDGFMEAKKAQLHVGGQTVVGGYFRGYEEGLGEDFFNMFGVIDGKQAIELAGV